MSESNKPAPSGETRGTWPEIPPYVVDPIVFCDKNLGICLLARQGDCQWVYRIHNGQWCSVRKVDAADPIFVTPLNGKPLAPEATTKGPEELLELLSLMYDRWEEGTACYEDPDDHAGFIGNAIKLSFEEENRIIAALKDVPRVAPGEAVGRAEDEVIITLHTHVHELQQEIEKLEETVSTLRRERDHWQKTYENLKKVAGELAERHDGTAAELDAIFGKPWAKPLHEVTAIELKRDLLKMFAGEIRALLSLEGDKKGTQNG